MKNKGIESKEIRSMDEYEKRYFPKSFQERILKAEDSPSIGARLARESLNKVQDKLQKKS